MGVEYEDAKKMAEDLNNQPTGKDLDEMNFAMVKAMKSKPVKKRMLNKKVKVSDSEKKEFDKLDTDSKALESDKKSTDMTDDKMMNEIWANKGRVAESDDTDAKKRTDLEGAKKKIRKMTGMCMTSCPDNKSGMGFFHDKKSNICFKCKADCQKCSMYEGQCSTCAFGMYEVNDKSDLEVEDAEGKVSKISTKKCAKCHASCKRCSGPAEADCKGCPEGFQLDAKTKKCVKGTRCLPGTVQVDSADAECTNDDGTKCKECKACTDSNCHRCDDKLKCMQCKKGFTRSGAGACTKCSKGCLKCKDANTCLMCDKKFYLLENSKGGSSTKVMCVERCPVFYRAIGMKNVD
jgi:hypothetical protein